MKHLLAFIIILAFTACNNEACEADIDLLSAKNTYIIDSINLDANSNLIGCVEVSRNNNVLGFIYIYATEDNYEGQKIFIFDYTIISKVYHQNKVRLKKSPGVFSGLFSFKPF